ncbi:biotin transporter BioY [Dongia sp.]|uniref:biotin transporter BioY n=1 Tax=Dongia sp. TaxID=1977262 RepID=UPI0037529039
MSIENPVAPGQAYVPLRLAGRPLALKALVLALGIAFLTASSWVQVPMWPVPMTMQTFAVLMVGALCGWRLGVATVVAWLALAVQFPLLSEFKTLPMVATTSGYLAAFVIMAGFVGYMAERGYTARPVPAFLVLLVAEVICFALGVGYLGAVIGYDKAVQYGLMPFLFGDFVKLLLAVALLTGLRRMLPQQI